MKSGVRSISGRLGRQTRNLIVGVILAGCAAGCASDLERRFQAHINYLASDQLEGRGVGSPGIELAADYIAARFRELGLEPAGVDGTYFQPFRMTLRRTLSKTTSLTIREPLVELVLGEEFIPFSFSSVESFSGAVAFCGYGIQAPEHQHDDFADIDVAGKVVLMLRGEPPSWSDEDGDQTRHAMFRNKVYNAKDREAAAVLIVNQAPGTGEEDALVEFVSEGTAAYGVPAFHLKRAVASRLLGQAGFENLDTLQERLDAGSTVSGNLKDLSVEGQAVFEEVKTTTRNVLGLWRGSGPLAEEYVIVGAHYDHLGVRTPRMRRFKGGKLVRVREAPQIHNGADDNASGTSGVIEVARMLVHGSPPNRSVLFIAFTGEESGLLGSKHYIKHPTVPSDATVAMLNMDMIGRLEKRSKEIMIFGARSADWFLETLNRNAESLGLKVMPTGDTGGRSDHAPFIRQGIPAMHFFTGFNGDYHKPTDDSHKINASGGANVVSLVYEMAHDIATRDSRPVFVDLPSEPKTTSSESPSYRVVMGITPGYGDDGKPGMAVDGVAPEGPADSAGMKADDRIIRIGGREVANIQDYMAALRNNNPGDSVEVIVLREGKEHIFSVKLASAR